MAARDLGGRGGGRDLDLGVIFDSCAAPLAAESWGIVNGFFGKKGPGAVCARRGRGWKALEACLPAGGTRPCETGAARRPRRALGGAVARNALDAPAGCWRAAGRLLASVFCLRRTHPVCRCFGSPWSKPPFRRALMPCAAPRRAPPLQCVQAQPAARGGRGHHLHRGHGRVAVPDQRQPLVPAAPGGVAGTAFTGVSGRANKSKRAGRRGV